ncbi:MAG: UMP kinase [Methanobrevibacter sp.]|jgi:uridylate kinase|nr:UMP kinase [Candidatus Methanovirga basalitermitum]
MRIVIAIGGSVIVKNKGHEKFHEYGKILKDLSEENELFVVVGGGILAREYIKIARDLGVNEAQCDDIGIDVTRLNARLLILTLGEYAYPEVPHTFQEAMKFASNRKIVVMGGTEPAHSTDAVGAILTEFIDGDLFVNLTSVNGMYDKDPNKFNDSKLIEEITTNEMLNLIKDKEAKAGTYEFMDMTAIQMIKRSSFQTIVANGYSPENLIKAVKGEKIGTRIIQ